MKTQKATFRGIALPAPSASNSGPFQCKTSTLYPDNGKNKSQNVGFLLSIDVICLPKMFSDISNVFI